MSIMRCPHWSKSTTLLSNVSALVDPILRSVIHNLRSGWGHRLLTSSTTVALCRLVRRLASEAWRNTRIACISMLSATLDRRAKLRVHVIIVDDAVVVGETLGHVVLIRMTDFEIWRLVWISLRIIDHILWRWRLLVVDDFFFSFRWSWFKIY